MKTINFNTDTKGLVEILSGKSFELKYETAGQGYFALYFSGEVEGTVLINNDNDTVIGSLTYR